MEATAQINTRHLKRPLGVGALRFVLVMLRVVLLLALASCVYLILQSETWMFIIGTTMIAVGVVVYWRFAPKSELIEVQERILSEEQRLAAIERALLVAPAYALRRIRGLIQETHSSRR